MGSVSVKGGRGLLLVIIAAMIMAPLLQACGGQQPQKKAVVNGGQEIKIAVSLASMERDGNQVFMKTMNERAGQNGQQGSRSQPGSSQGQAAVPVQAQNGGQQGGQSGQNAGQGGQQGQQNGPPRVKITWLDAKNDPLQQEKDLEQLVGQDVKAVILQAVDPAAAPNLVRKLAQANIKVLAFETLPANAPVDGYIASDHARAGELEARYLITAAQNRGAPVNTVLLMGDQNDQTSKEIASSVLQNLQNQPQVRIVQARNHARGEPQLAVATLDQALADSNNQIDAVLATDGRIAAAVINALDSRGLNQRIITVGVGADQQASQALMAGTHQAEVDLMPEIMAQHAYDAAVGLATTGHWQYEKQIKNGDFDVPAKITPVRLLTKQDAYLLEQRWGKLTGQEDRQQGQQGQQQGRQMQQQGQEGQEQGQQQGQGEQQEQNQRQEQKQGQQQGQGQQQDQQGQQGPKTTLRITTQDGKTVEMQINGEIKKIETIDGAGAAEGGGGQPGGKRGQ